MSSHFSLSIITIWFFGSVLHKYKLDACLFSKALSYDMFISSARYDVWGLRFLLRHDMRRRCKYLINTAFAKIASFFHIIFFLNIFSSHSNLFIIYFLVRWYIVILFTVDVLSDLFCKGQFVECILSPCFRFVYGFEHVSLLKSAFITKQYIYHY